MVLWFAGMSWLTVWRVFRSPSIDYRLVVVGAVLPVVDVVIGRPTPLHTVLGAIVAFGLVAGVTRNRRLASRQWVGVPIGLFFHLVFDATWSVTELFWWPFAGEALAGLSVPEADWPLVVTVGTEVIGALVLVGLWVRLGLTDPTRRQVFLRTGHLDREVA